MNHLKNWWFAYATIIGVLCFVVPAYLTMPEEVLLPGRHLREITFTEKHSYIEDYYTCLEHIMFNEGFRRRVYVCAAGQRTIGFGHQLLPGETFRQPITHQQGYRLLKKDFDKAIQYAKRLGFVRGNNKQLAVAHAIFAMGCGTASIVIRDGFSEHIRLYSGYYDAEGNYVKRQTCDGREFEYKLYTRR